MNCSLKRPNPIKLCGTGSGLSSSVMDVIVRSWAAALETGTSAIHVSRRFCVGWVFLCILAAGGLASAAERPGFSRAAEVDGAGEAGSPSTTGSRFWCQSAPARDTALAPIDRRRLSDRYGVGLKMEPATLPAGRFILIGSNANPLVRQYLRRIDWPPAGQPEAYVLHAVRTRWWSPATTTTAHFTLAVASATRGEGGRRIGDSRRGDRRLAERRLPQASACICPATRTSRSSAASCAISGALQVQ